MREFLLAGVFFYLGYARNLPFLYLVGIVILVVGVVEPAVTWCLARKRREAERQAASRGDYAKFFGKDSVMERDHVHK